MSAPTPFNNNHLNVKKFENGANVTVAGSAIYKNNNIYNNNLYNSNSSNLNRQQNARVFDNHNIINNYQTTSPFSNQRTFANHLITNNTVLRPTSTFANTVASPVFSQQKPTNESGFYPSNQYLVTTTMQSPPIPQSQIVRNSLPQERPNFNQQDLINQFNLEQRKLLQQKQSQSNNNYNNNNANNNNVQNSNQRSNDAQAYLSLEQRRLQLHYDINDYLTTDKQNTPVQYSPTSEQYRSIQPFSNSNVKTLQSNQFFSQKSQEALVTTTPKINRLSIETNYNQQYQTQQDRPSQPPNHKPNFNAQLNNRSDFTTTTKQTSVNNNNIISTSTKKFSTLVPKENYAPTTFKPLFYFNVAKQINDNLSTPTKPKATNDDLITSTTLRSNPITPIFNRNLEFSQFNFRELPEKKQQTLPLQQQAPKNLQTNITEIDENDGQYHAELYEKGNHKNQHLKIKIIIKIY